MMIMMPQVLNYLKISVYDTAGELLYTRELDSERTIDFRVGSLYSFAISKQ